MAGLLRVLLVIIGISSSSSNLTASQSEQFLNQSFMLCRESSRNYKVVDQEGPWPAIINCSKGPQLCKF